MTIAKLIACLKKCKHISRAEVTFFVGEKEYDLSRIGQFGVVPDVNIDLVERKI